MLRIATNESCAGKIVEVYGLASIKDLKIGGPAKGASKGSAQAGAKTRSKAVASNEKELQRLRRIDLLELLLDEIRQNEESATQLKELTELTERLKGKLDDKDAQIERLKAKLDAKDAEIERLLANNAATAHANGMLDVDELLNVERRALQAYLERVPGRATTFSRAAHAAPMEPAPIEPEA